MTSFLFKTDFFPGVNKRSMHEPVTLSLPKITEMVWTYTVSDTHVVAVAFVALVRPDTTVNCESLDCTSSTQSDSTHPPIHTNIHHNNAMIITQALML